MSPPATAEVRPLEPHAAWSAADVADPTAWTHQLTEYARTIPAPRAYRNVCPAPSSCIGVSSTTTLRCGYTSPKSSTSST